MMHIPTPTPDDVDQKTRQIRPKSLRSYRDDIRHSRCSDLSTPMRNSQYRIILHDVGLEGYGTGKPRTHPRRWSRFARGTAVEKIGPCSGPGYVGGWPDLRTGRSIV